MHFFYLLVVIVASTMIGWGSWDDDQYRLFTHSSFAPSLENKYPTHPQLKRHKQGHPRALALFEGGYQEERYPCTPILEVQHDQRRRRALKTRASSPLRPVSGAEETTEEETDIDTSPDFSSLEEGQMGLSPSTLERRSLQQIQSRRVPLLPSDLDDPEPAEQAQEGKSCDYDEILDTAGTPPRKASFQHAKWEDCTPPLDKQDPFYDFADWVRQHPQNAQQYAVNFPSLQNLFLEDAMAWSLVRQVAQEFCNKGKLKDHTAKRLKDQIEEFQGKDLDEHYKRFMTLLQAIVEQKTQTAIRVKIQGWHYSV